MLRRSVASIFLPHIYTDLRASTLLGLIVGMYNPKGLSVPKIPHEKVFLGVPIGHSRKPILLGNSILLVLVLLTTNTCPC